MQNGFMFSVTRKKNSHSSAAQTQSFFICVSAFMSPYCPLAVFLIASFDTFQLCRHAMDKNTAKPLALLHHCMFLSTGFKQSIPAVAFFFLFQDTTIPNPIKNKKEVIEKHLRVVMSRKKSRVACNKQQNINNVTLTMECNCHSGLD